VFQFWYQPSLLSTTLLELRADQSATIVLKLDSGAFVLTSNTTSEVFLGNVSLVSRNWQVATVAFTELPENRSVQIDIYGFTQLALTAVIPSSIRWNFLCLVPTEIVAFDEIRVFARPLEKTTDLSPRNLVSRLERTGQSKSNLAAYFRADQNVYKFRWLDVTNGIGPHQVILFFTNHPWF